jgi:HEAT repeat protein
MFVTPETLKDILKKQAILDLTFPSEENRLKLLSALENWIREEKPPLQTHALLALRFFPSSRIESLVLKRLKSQQNIHACLETLGYIGSEHLLPSLLPFTQSEHFTLRWHAIEAIDRICQRYPTLQPTHSYHFSHFLKLLHASKTSSPSTLEKIEKNRKNRKNSFTHCFC